MTWPPAAGGAMSGPEPGPEPGVAGPAERRGADEVEPSSSGVDARALPALLEANSFGEHTLFLPGGNGDGGGGGGVPWEKKPPAPEPAEATQQHLVERMRSLMETTRDIVFMLDTGGRLTLLSRSFEKLTGWSRQEWLGRHFGPLIHPDDLRIAQDVMAGLLRGEAPPPHEVRLLKRDGGCVAMEMVSTPVKANGQVVEVVGSGRDISERKEAERERAKAQQHWRAKEEAEAANRAKDEFLAALSHELRTPLTPILTLATALEDEALPWPCQDAMQIVRRNVELEARLIDDLLDLTRIIRGKLHLRSEVVDAHRLLREVMEICEEDLREKRLRAEVDLGAAESVVRGDPARLQQVFWNLVKNAVKFTPAGGTVWVSTANGDEGRRLRVCVRDNGVGISPEAMGKIFEAFEQGGDEVTRRYGGLGLGLAIGKGIVEQHGGRIAARSGGPGKGATFEVELATEPGAREQEARPAGRRPARAMRILLVEDHADTARVMKTLLKGMGHHVVWATGARAALEAVGREAFDLMISDLGLPDGTGWDLMRDVKRVCPDIRGIALSGYGMENDLRRSREAGFEEHVVKPFNFARLTELIHKVTDEEG